jgi:heat shock protein HslJ
MHATPQRIGLPMLALLAGVNLLACGGRGPAPPVSPSAVVGLLDTQWSLVQLGEETAGVGAGGRAPTLLLAATETRVTGFAGCNHLAAAYDLAADRLTFSPIITTRMFCAGAMELEERYLAALETTRAYRLLEEELELFGDRGLVARFRAP